MWASAIRHAALNVSAASTVTLEFAAYGRPVINPVFGGRAKELFDSSFYGEARRNGWGQSASTWAEIEDLIVRGLAKPAKAIQAAPHFGAAAKALELVKRLGASGAMRTPAVGLSSVRA